MSAGCTSPRMAAGWCCRSSRATASWARPPSWRPCRWAGPRPDDVTAVLADLAAPTVLQTQLRPTFLAAPAWKQAAQGPGMVAQPRQVHVLDLPGGIDVIWAECFGSDPRRSLRIAQRRADTAGLTLDSGSSPDLVADLFDLYLRVVDRRTRARRSPVGLARRRAVRAEPRRKFDVVESMMGSYCRIRAACSGLADRPVVVASPTRWASRVASRRWNASRESWARAHVG
jgi:hypothetical protein